MDFLKMSSSDQDSMSEAASSPYQHSPRSSPSQQMPQLAHCFTELTCAEINGYPSDRPYLRIVEQPQNHFRFRYKSEMVGTHGCLLGKTSSNNKNKTHPMVELVNYKKRALIRCRLAQHLKGDEHPHQLLEDEQEDRDVSAIVEPGSYRVAYAGMGIIHTAKKDVPGLLFKKYKEWDKNINHRELRNHCETEAKGINLNIVRLRFSAHDIDTDQEICEPVFSEPIHNMKSAATNDLKICRISRLYGQPKGGDDVYILVEKVNKKNIEIRFVERDESGEEVWSAKAHFLQNDVHHQYAIVFRTPAYRDQLISTDVKVQVELVRPTDGRCSDPKEFTYRADPLSKQSKKRKASSSPYSSFNSSLSGGSIKSMSDLPDPVLMLAQNTKTENENTMVIEDVMVNAMPHILENQGPLDLGDALLEENSQSGQGSLQLQCTVSPMMPQAELQPITFDSAEFDHLLNHVPAPEREENYMEYMQQCLSSTNMDFLKATLLTDSGRGSAAKKTVPHRPAPTDKSEEAGEKSNSEYPAGYTPEQGEEVRKLVKDICDIIRSKTGFQKQVVKEKLTRLFSMRLSNGDTFLHMTLFNNRTSFEYVVKLVQAVKMTHLLNLGNDAQQTILHSAVINDLPQLVPFLISKGCDPSACDQEGNNAVHLAVQYQSCLEPLLDAIKKYGVACDLNAENKDKQTALHLAAVPGLDPSATQAARRSCRLLLRHGASYSVRDQEGRTPLHLAVLDDCLPIVRSLLEAIPPSDIDAVDGCGNTALQIVCGGDIRSNTVAILRLLIDKKADPMKHEPHTAPAWRQVRDKPALRELLAPLAATEDDVKSEPEDDYESADEGEDTCLSDLPLYVHELSSLLDGSGAWRALAARLQHDALANWYQHTSSPTRTLLHQLRESQDSTITSRSLIMILEDIGQMEAARLIRSRIE